MSIKKYLLALISLTLSACSSSGLDNYVPKTYTPAGPGFGAIAVDLVGGVNGTSQGYATLTDAENAALAACGTPNCKIVGSEQNTCVAVAYDSSGDWYATPGDNSSADTHDSASTCEYANTISGHVSGDPCALVFVCDTNSASTASATGTDVISPSAAMSRSALSVNDRRVLNSSLTNPNHGGGLGQAGSGTPQVHSSINAVPN